MRVDLAARALKVKYLGERNIELRARGVKQYLTLWLAPWKIVKRALNLLDLPSLFPASDNYFVLVASDLNSYLHALASFR